MSYPTVQESWRRDVKGIARRLILLEMCFEADDDGWFAGELDVGKIAHYARCHVRTVRRAIMSFTEIGLLVRRGAGWAIHLDALPEKPPYPDDPDDIEGGAE